VQTPCLCREYLSRVQAIAPRLPVVTLPEAPERLEFSFNTRRADLPRALLRPPLFTSACRGPCSLKVKGDHMSCQRCVFGSCRATMRLVGGKLVRWQASMRFCSEQERCMPILHVRHAPCLSLHWSGGTATSRCAASGRHCPVAALQGGQSGGAAAKVTHEVRLRKLAGAAGEGRGLQSR
jgi:hypothetical protein